MGDIYLQPPSSRADPPFAIADFGYRPGNEAQRIIAGFQPGSTIPNVWELISGKFIITTDATVANRLFYFHQKMPDDSAVLTDVNGPTVTASSTWKGQIQPYSVSDQFLQGLDDSLGRNKFFGVIYGNMRHTIGVTNGVAGDTLFIRCLYRFLNWDLGMMEPRLWVGW